MAEPALPRSELEASLEALHEASFGWARSCCHGDPDAAADVLQTTYAKVLSGAASFGARSSFKTWLFGVIRLTSHESRRRGVRERAMVARLEPNDGDRAADAVLIDAEQGAALRGALVRLPQRQQEVIHLVFYQGLSIAEAAGVMDVSLGSARTHYDRGKKRLRALLAPTLGRTHPGAIVRRDGERTDTGDPGSTGAGS